MKAWYIAVFLSQFLIAAISAAPLDTDCWQVAHYGTKKFDNLNYKGYISLDRATIIHRAHIDGYVHARFSDFGSLYVNGHTKIQDSNVRGECHIEGGLLAINVSFSKGLTCRSSEISLSLCKLPYLRVQGNPGEEQIVELCD